MGRNAFHAVMRVPVRLSRRFAKTVSRQDDVRKKLSIAVYLCRDAGVFGGDEWAVSSFGHERSKRYCSFKGDS